MVGTGTSLRVKPAVGEVLTSARTEGPEEGRGDRY